MSTDLHTRSRTCAGRVEARVAANQTSGRLSVATRGPYKLSSAAFRFASNATGSVALSAVLGGKTVEIFSQSLSAQRNVLVTDINVWLLPVGASGEDYVQVVNSTGAACDVILGFDR